MKPTKHKLTAKLYLELTVEVEGTYTPARPGTFYRSNGDPGDPPEYAEFNITKVTCNTTKPDEHLNITSILLDSDFSSLEDSCLEQLSEPDDREPEL